ncbi:MAG: cytochrome b [Hyphomonadaceae bacterium]
MTQAEDRYSTVAIALHWLIALLILINIFVGGAMEDASGPARRGIFIWHQSLGISVLALTLLRLGWRVGHKAPALPAHMAAWEKALAHGVHVAFYVLLLAIPLLGWAAVSAGRNGVAPLFDAIPFFNLPIPKSREAHDVFGEAHEAAVKGMYVLVALHVIGALKHKFVDRDSVLGRMLPFLRRAG